MTPRQLSMTQGPDDAVLRVALEVLRRNFGMDVSPAAGLTGDALLKWVQAADKVLCERGHAALCSTSGPNGPNLFEAFNVIDESDKKA